MGEDTKKPAPQADEPDALRPHAAGHEARTCENRQAEALLRRRTSQLNILLAAAQRLNAVLEAPAILRTLVACAMELTEAAAGMAGQVVDGKMVFREYNKNGAVQPIDHTFAAGRGIPGWVLQNRKPYVCNDTQRDELVDAEIREALGFYNLVNVPIICRRGELLGCFEIQNTKDRRPFDDQDVEMLQGLADLASVALDNATLIDDRRRSAEELASLSSLAHQVSASLSLEHVVRVAIEHVVGLIPSDLAVLYLREGDDLILQGVFPPTPEFQGDEAKTLPVGECLCGLVALEGKPIYCLNIHEDPRCTLDKCKLAGICSFAALPLRNGDSVLGVLGLASKSQRDYGAQAAYLETVSNQIVVGLQNALLYEQVQRHEAELGQRVTDLKQAEDVLRESEGKYRTLMENLGDAIFIADAKTGIIFDTNKQAEALMGMGRDEIIGMHQTMLHPEQERKRYSSMFREHFTKGKAIEENVYVRHKNGRLIPVEISAAKVPVGNRKVVQGLFRDLTERRRMEEELRQAQKMEAVGRLAGGIAHDFNNQLTVINGYCDVLLRELAADDPSRSALKEIRRAAERSTRLTSQLLAFSRRQMLVPEVLNINDLLTEMAETLASLIGESIHLLIDPADDLHNVEADPHQLQQVVINLALNARDAMPRGGQLTIETGNVELDEDYASYHQGAAAGRYVMMAVSDTGVGMDAETLKNVFEPFFTTKETGKGTGLGLSMVHGFVRQSGGHIAAYSKVGKGTRIEIYLPRVRSAARRTGRPSPAQAYPRGNETILLAEDDKAVRQLIASVLRKCGYEVTEASSAAEALPLADRSASPIDLLVTDVVMPEMTGPELARRLKDTQPGMSVLFISGYTETTKTLKEVVDENATLLTKPFAPQRLAETVREVLDAGRRN